MRIARLVLISIGTLLAAALVLAVALGVNGWNRLHQRQAHALQPLRVAPHDSLLSRGEHLARLLCTSCHSPDGRLPLAGGSRNLLARTHWGELRGPALTRDGVLDQASDEQLARAIREGVGRDGRALLGMPSRDLRSLSDRDLAALLTYLRTQPAVGSSVRPRRLAPLAYLLLGLRVVETSVQAPVDGPVETVPSVLSAEHGRYLADILGCRSCHGERLDGRGAGGLAQHGPGLVNLVRTHDLARFAAAVRDGRAMTREGALGEPHLPATPHAHIDDTEIGSLYTHLQDLGRKR